MATTTPNYGWPVPTSTDYVKDGATAIEALGDAIDATVFGLPDKVLASGNFTTQSAINLTSVLNDTYKFYTLNFYAISSTGNSTINLRFRENTSDKTTGYFVESTIITATGNVSNFNSSSSTSQISVTRTDTTVSSSSKIEIFRTSASQGKIINTSWDSGTGGAIYGVANNSGLTDFNGLSFYPATGTITGYYILTGRKA